MTLPGTAEDGAGIFSSTEACSGLEFELSPKGCSSVRFTAHGKSKGEVWRTGTGAYVELHVSGFSSPKFVRSCKQRSHQIRDSLGPASTYLHQIIGLEFLDPTHQANISFPALSKDSPSCVPLSIPLLTAFDSIYRKKGICQGLDEEKFSLPLIHLLNHTEHPDRITSAIYNRAYVAKLKREVRSHIQDAMETLGAVRVYPRVLGHIHEELMRTLHEVKYTLGANNGARMLILGLGLG